MALFGKKEHLQQTSRATVRAFSRIGSICRLCSINSAASFDPSNHRPLSYRDGVSEHAGHAPVSRVGVERQVNRGLFTEGESQYGRPLGYSSFLRPPGKFDRG